MTDTRFEPGDVVALAHPGLTEPFIGRVAGYRAGRVVCTNLTPDHTPGAFKDECTWEFEHLKLIGGAQ